MEPPEISVQRIDYTAVRYRLESKRIVMAGGNYAELELPALKFRILLKRERKGTSWRVAVA